MADGSVSMPRGKGDCWQGARLRSALSEYSDARMATLPRGRGVAIRGSDKRSLVVEEVAKELGGLEPFTEEEAKRVEKRKELLLYTRKMERYRQEHQTDLQWELKDRLLDFDPKQGGNYYNRYHHVDLRKFDLDEESPHGPMRFTNAVYKDEDDYELCGGINIYSVKIACSDVGFPIHVYGTVIARDSIDRRCVYLFRRDRDHCQIINSEDDSLILTGPKRGLAKMDNVFIETDLKIRDHQGQDRELSKGVLTLGRIGTLTKLKVKNVSLATRLSTVDVLYGYVEDAVEGTMEIEVIQGYFDGQITAHTTSTPNRLVLYDRELHGDVKGAIQLTRPIVCVSLKEMLVIVAKTRDGKSERTILFTPRVNNGDEDVIVVGDVKMRVKVYWSIMDL